MPRHALRLERLEDRTLPSAAQFVTSLYGDLLNRTPAQSEVDTYVHLLQTGVTPTAVAGLFTSSPEYYNRQTLLDYEDLLGRESSAAELQAWLTQRQAGLTQGQEEVAFLASPEYYAKQGGTALGWLQGVYRDVLHRPLDPTGQAWFLAMDLSSPAGRGQVASFIVFSPEESALIVDEAYVLLLHRHPEASALTNWSNQVSAGLAPGRLLADLAGSTEYVNTRAGGLDDVGNPSDSGLITLNLKPLDIKLLGLEVQTNAIQVKVSARTGSGELLGNLLTDVSHLLNLQGVNNALNTVLDSVVTLLNSVDLNVSGVGSGQFDTAAAATTPVLDAFVAPVHLNLLGALVDTSPIHLTIVAHSGPGLILGNVISDLANLFNPPLPNTLNLDFVNTQLRNLLSELNAQIPGIGTAPPPVTTTTPAPGTERVLSLALAPINLNLLGLVLQTSQIQVNADAQTGNGDLLGNVLTTLLNTLGATPQNLTDLSNNLNGLLAKVIGVLNAATLTLPSGAVDTLSQVLQTLALPNLVNASGTASAPILNLSIASTDGTTPPVDVNLLGVVVTTSDIQAQLLAQTGDGQILGNLLYNVAHLLDPGGSLNLLAILNQLGL